MSLQGSPLLLCYSPTSPAAYRCASSLGRSVRANQIALLTRSVPAPPPTPRSHESRANATVSLNVGGGVYIFTSLV